MTGPTANGAGVSAWRHARAIVLLPFMNTVVIPSALLVLWPPAQHAGAARAAALVGVVLLLCGSALVAHSIRLFVALGRGTLAPWDPTHELVAAGAYRYSRNPLKSGLFLILAGEALLAQSAAIGGWLALFALVNVAYIRVHEEPALARRFGEPYRDYCARVPRWWPTLRSRRTCATEITTP